MKDVPACWTWRLPTVPGCDPWWDMADWQDGRCAACGQRAQRMVNDHDHCTGLVRGFLCHGCNVREGMSGPTTFWERYRHVNPATIVGLEMTYGYGSECAMHDSEFSHPACNARAKQIRARTYPHHYCYSVKLDRDSE